MRDIFGRRTGREALGGGGRSPGDGCNGMRAEEAVALGEAAVPDIFDLGMPSYPRWALWTWLPGGERCESAALCKLASELVDGWLP